MSDYSYVEIESWETLNGVKVPKNRWGHYLDWNYIRGNEARQLTSPYGTLHYAVGNSECDEECDGDFTTFFDFAELPDERIVLHAVVNTESGGYIGDAEYLVVDRDCAYMVAMDMVYNAMEAVEMNEVRHDSEGWNQDEFYFARAVKSFVERGISSAPRFEKVEAD